MTTFVNGVGSCDICSAPLAENHAMRVSERTKAPDIQHMCNGCGGVANAGIAEIEKVIQGMRTSWIRRLFIAMRAQRKARVK